MKLAKKTFPKESLESIQQYDILWEDFERDHIPGPFKCGYCLEELVKERDDVCSLCLKSLEKLEG